MSMLDKAFVRAYSRSRTAAPVANQSPSLAPATNDHVAVSRPAAVAYSQSAAVPASDQLWQPVQFGSSGLDESYFRVDVGHMPQQRVQSQVAAPAQTTLRQPHVTMPTSSPTQVATAPAPAARQPKRAMPGALSHTLTAFADLADAPTDTVMRIDRPHPYQTPNAIPAPAVDEEVVDYQHINLQTDEALAFALAKAEALRQAPVTQPAKPTLANAIMRDLAEARALQQQIAEQKEEELQRQEREQIAEQNRVAQIERLERFTQRPVPAAPKPFNAVWEVDAFEFSDVVVKLFGQASLLDSIGTPLDQAVANGLRSILITSQSRGVGRTSVAIGIAVAAASAGLKVALVDADLSTGGLADSLRLEVAQDWFTAIRQELPLEEAAVRSIEDQLTVLPINATKPGVTCSADEFDSMMKRLRSQFDLVVVDGAPWNASLISLPHVKTLDAAIVVVDAKSQDDAALHTMQVNLKESGIQGLGLVENFS